MPTAALATISVILGLIATPAAAQSASATPATTAAGGIEIEGDWVLAHHDVEAGTMTFIAAVTTCTINTSIGKPYKWTSGNESGVAQTSTVKNVDCPTSNIRATITSSSRVINGSWSSFPKGTQRNISAGSPCRSSKSTKWTPGVQISGGSHRKGNSWAATLTCG